MNAPSPTPETLGHPTDGLTVGLLAELAELDSRIALGRVAMGRLIQAARTVSADRAMASVPGSPYSEAGAILNGAADVVATVALPEGCVLSSVRTGQGCSGQLDPVNQRGRMRSMAACGVTVSIVDLLPGLLLVGDGFEALIDHEESVVATLVHA